MTNSNTSPDRCRHLRARWLQAFFALLSLPHDANALDPNEAMSRYIHDQWSAEQGYPGGPAYAITQTDGYLWIGTANGLVQIGRASCRERVCYAV